MISLYDLFILLQKGLELEMNKDMVWSESKDNNKPHNNNKVCNLTLKNILVILISVTYLFVINR